MMKLLPSFVIAGGISYRFYAKLGVDWISLWPFIDKLDLGLRFIPLTFVLTLSIVNAINITDGLDGLAGGLLVVVLTVLGGVTFLHGWNLATTIVGISIATLSAFLWYNAFPAKVFM
jgi:UDP-N-acetylmuramyl pentapeptide phosphotransferase/UDP-N-acetylglucosamine-1-phosphate transferase